MPSVVCSRELSESVRREWTATAAELMAAFNFQSPWPLRLMWVRQPAGEPTDLPIVDVDIRSDLGLISPRHEGVIFLGEEAWRSRNGLVGALAHELTHIMQLAGYCPSSGDHEVRARQIAADVAREWEEHELDFRPFAGLFEDSHYHGRFYQDLRAGRLAYPVKGGWTRAGFWDPYASNALSPSRPQTPPAPQNTNADRVCLITHEKTGETIRVLVSEAGPYANGRQLIELEAIP